MTTLALISPIDPDTGARVDVRVCASQSAAATGAAGQVWWPAIAAQPVLQIAMFDGDFTSPVEPGSANMEIRLDVLARSGQFARVLRYDWSGAKVSLYRLVAGALTPLAEMKVERFAAEDFRLALALVVDDEPLQDDVLFRSYAGTTGAEGGADLKDRPKPWVFGRALNVEPVFIDQIDNVFQVSGYGPVQAIPAVYERGASFGASIGNFANYAALVAATIPEGRWGTCLAEGMFRLGAPPAGVITCDVDGDNTSDFIRRTGGIIKEIARRLGRTGQINAGSLDALDAAVARNVNIVISDQTTLLELARRMAAPCNAVAGLGFDGKLITPRVAFGSQSMALDAQGRQMPPVLGMARQNTQPPYKRIKMGAARSWRVHSLDEIAFIANLIDRGLYDAATTYREGDIVSSADKSRWVYTNPTASAGNAPPAWPTVSNAYWENLDPPANIASLPGSLPWSRTEGSGRPETFTFGARGVSASNRPSNYADGLFNEAGTIIGGGFARSYTVHHRNIGSTTWTSAVFDVFASTAQATAMAAHLDAIASGAVVVVLGFDEPRNNRLFGALPAAMYRCGASRSVFGRNNWFFRPAYALIGRAGIGEGLGSELFQDGGADSSADSWVSGTFSIVNGIPVVGFSPIRGAEDISYPNGVRLDELQPSESGADVTATAQRTIEPQFPVIEIKQGEAGHTGNRTITHVAKRGTATLTGGTWSLPSENLGAGDATINSGTGTVTLSGIVQSGAYSVRYTHSDGIATDLAVNVTFVPLVGAGVGSIASSVVKPFSGTSFTAISNAMTIQLPAGVTVANLLAGNIVLDVPPSFPTGETNVEAKWQRETSPGTWADVGAAAAASPHPAVIDEGGFPGLISGLLTCNRTATGLSAGSTQTFRLVARVSGGEARTVTPFGTVTAGG